MSPLASGEIGVGVGELVAELVGDQRVFLHLHVAAGVPLPDGFALGRNLEDGVAVHAAVGMLGAGKPAGNALRDLGRHHLPAEEDGVAVRQPAEIVVLADVPVLPQHLAVPVVFAKQPAAAAHVLRAFGQPAGPEQIAVVEQIGVGAVDQRMLPLVQHVAAQADDIGRLAVQRREQRQPRRRAMRIANQKPEIAVTHRQSPLVPTARSMARGRSNDNAAIALRA